MAQQLCHIGARRCGVKSGIETMKPAPNGFPHYRDLFLTENHVIYSFRHSFEKRMLETGLNYGLRCLLMGHTNNRPASGDGGSLGSRRDEWPKIVYPYPEALFAA